MRISGYVKVMLIAAALGISTSAFAEDLLGQAVSYQTSGLSGIGRAESYISAGNYLEAVNSLNNAINNLNASSILFQEAQNAYGYNTAGNLQANGTMINRGEYLMSYARGRVNRIWP